MSVIKHSEQRVGIFIDAQNLYHSAKNLYSRNVNFGNVVDEAVAGRIIVRSIAYVITSEAGDETGFFDALTKSGIETKTKDLQVFSSGAKKGDWDVGLAVDAIKMSHKLDTVIIVAGDGDFIPLVEYLKHTGCQVEAVAFGRSTSSKLKEVVDDFIDLDEDPEHFLMGGKKGPFRKRPYHNGPRNNTHDTDYKNNHSIPELLSLPKINIPSSTTDNNTSKAPQNITEKDKSESKKKPILKKIRRKITQKTKNLKENKKS